MDMILSFLYTFFVVYVTWLTLLNIVFKLGTAAIRGAKWSITNGISLVYVSLWTLVFFLPVLKASVLD